MYWLGPVLRGQPVHASGSFHLADNHCPVLDVDTIYVKASEANLGGDQVITEYRMPPQQPQRLSKTYCTMIPYSVPPLHSLVCVHHIFPNQDKSSFSFSLL